MARKKVWHEKKCAKKKCGMKKMCAIKKGVAKKSVTVYCLPAVESSSAGSRIGSGSFACVDDESRNGQLVFRRGQEGVRSAYYELKFL